MKWPQRLTIIRHGQSAYNILRDKKKSDPEYQRFVRRFDASDDLASLQVMARQLQERFALTTSDYKTPLTPEGRRQAEAMGFKVLDYAGTPDVVFISPYVRTRETFEMMRAGTNLAKGRTLEVIDDRIREQEHGLSLLYSDWRIFHTMHPEQKALHKLQGPYWYQYPQGESVSMVRERIRSFLNMLVREYSGANVWLISHHLTKLSIRGLLERLSPEEFIRLDREEKPINCGVTVYEGIPDAGKNGKLQLKHYNLKLWD